MIFLSYSSLDSLYVHQYAFNLSIEKKTIWLDIWQLNLNKNIKEQIKEAIFNSDFIEVIDSPNSRASKWVNFEISFAKKIKIPIQYISYELIFNTYKNKSFKIYKSI